MKWDVTEKGPNVLLTPQPSEEGEGIELDYSALHDMREAFDQAIKSPAERVVLDVSSVSYIDSSGVGQLLRLDQEVRAKSRKIVIVTSEAFTNTLSLLRLTDKFVFASTVEEAELALEPTTA